MTTGNSVPGPRGRRGRIAAGGVILLPLLAIAIGMVIYFKRTGPEGKSYVETVVESKAKAETTVTAVELHGLYTDMQMTAIVSDGQFPSLRELLENSTIGYEYLRRPGEEDDHPCVYIEGQDQSMPADNVLVYDQSAAERTGEGQVLLRDGTVRTYSAERMKQAVAKTRRIVQGG